MSARLGDTIRFTAHDTAPNAEEAYNGVLIPDALGIHALRSYYHGSEFAVLDTSTEPPTLRFEEAPVEYIEGSLYSAEGKFEPYGDSDSVHLFQVTGEYTGPGSELKATEVLSGFPSRR